MAALRVAISNTDELGSRIANPTRTATHHRHADRYGPKHLGLIFGSMFTCMNLGFGIGSLLDGVIYETFGGYHAALIINVLLGAAAAATILLVPYLGRERAQKAAGRQLLAEGQAA